MAGILLALDEIEYGGFSIDSLTGDQTEGMRDGDKLMNAIRGRLTRSNVGPDVKKNKLPLERIQRYPRDDPVALLHQLP